MLVSTDHDLLVKLSDGTLELTDVSQDLRQRGVFDRYGAEIGHISDLLVDRESKNVRILQVAASDVLGLGDRHFLVPVAAVTRITRDAIDLDQSRETVVNSPPYDPRRRTVPFRESWTGYYRYYGYTPYWNPASIRPTLPRTS